MYDTMISFSRFYITYLNYLLLSSNVLYMGLGLTDDPPPYRPILGCRFHIVGFYNIYYN